MNFAMGKGIDGREDQEKNNYNRKVPKKIVLRYLENFFTQISLIKPNLEVPLW